MVKLLILGSIAVFLLIGFQPNNNVQAVSPTEAGPVKYVLTFPKIWRSKKDYEFHLVLFLNANYTMPTVFEANLTYADRVVATQTFMQTTLGLQKHTFKNMAQVQVPEAIAEDDDGESSGSYSINVLFKNIGLSNYTDMTSFPRQLTEKFVFIQTDKAIYKPAQNVKIRVLALDRDLRAMAGSNFSVIVEDPNSNTIGQWTKQTLQNGFLSVNFSTSDFSALGEWTITVEGGNLPRTTKTFTLAQYVLPKYEAKLEFPSGYWVLTPDDSYYKGYVKAKYTFGKSVKGTFSGYLKDTSGCLTDYDYVYSYGYPLNRYYDEDGVEGIESSMRTQQAPPRFNITGKLTADGSLEDGAFSVVGLNALLNPSKPTTEFVHAECALTFNVNVTEELTGEVISTSGFVKLYRSPYQIKTHDSVQKTSKPGLPFTMRFQVTKADGSNLDRAANVLVQIIHSFDTPNVYNSYYYNPSDTCSFIADNQLDQLNKLNISRQNVTATTDSSGIVEVVVTIPQQAKSTSFHASLVNDAKVFTCESRTPPKTVSNQSISIQIDRPLSLSKTIPKIGEKIKFRVSVSFKTTFVYFMMSQNGQVFNYLNLTRPLPGDGISSGPTVFTVEVILPREAAPSTSALVWTVENTSNEILADALEIKIDGYVQQNVSASFTPTVVKPGDSTRLKLKTTEPSTTVALLAVDKSVRLLKSGNDITLDDVVGAVGAGNDYTPASAVLWRCWICDWWPSWVDSSSAESVFSGVGMVIKSNAITTQMNNVDYYPEYEDQFGGERSGAANERADVFRKEADPAPGPVAASNKPSSSADSSSTKPRENFPETWIWQVVQTNSAGEISQDFLAPDTITSWALSALAVGTNKGFGALPSPVELTVFQDFFVNIDNSHPTIIRGEQVQVKAVVFNYQSSPIIVNTILKASVDFEATLDNSTAFASANINKRVVVPANLGASFPIWIRPKKLGKIYLEFSGAIATNAKSSDAMKKEVTVEAEGEVKYANKPLLIRMPTASTMKQTIDADALLGPAAGSIVDGSKLIQLQAMGDVLGPALSNLGSQIRLPTGCGEQTMLTLAPNVFIYRYLKNAGVLTPDVQTKAIGFVDNGYQHELTYQRTDGGISAFGNSDTSSSTWLTAFVLRCFNAAVKYMGTKIDGDVFTKLWSFVKSQASPTGLFTEPGRVIHYSMKGGATSDVNLAAYIYAAYAEAGGDSDNAWISVAATKTLITETANSASNRDPFQLAMTAYALSILPEDKSASLAILNKLMTLATTLDGQTYWEPQNLTSTTGSKRVINEYDQSGPGKIETAGYALLALTNHNQTDSAINVARWLVAQRNSIGGFMSTQDTVVGLQALAEVAPLLASSNNALTIAATFNFADGNRTVVSTSMSVNRNNARVLQSFDPDRSRQALKTVDLVITGSGVGLVQLAIRYNVLNKKLLDSGDYSIKVTREVMARRKRDANELPLTDINVQLKACAKPVTDKAKRDGMVVLEVGVPTGFEANLDGTINANYDQSIAHSTSFPAPLKMIESGERKLVYYFDSLADSATGAGACVVSQIKRTTPVANVQPPIARVYAYYMPAQFNTTQFSFVGMSSGMTRN